MYQNNMLYIKKVCTPLLIVLILSIFPCHAVFAGQIKTYKLRKEGFMIKLPENYSVVTRDVKEGAPELAELGLSRQEMIKRMNTKGTYLEAFDFRRGHLISVGKYAPQVENYNNKSDKELMDRISSGMQSLPHDNLKVRMHKNKRFKFTMLYYEKTADGMTSYHEEFSTETRTNSYIIAFISCGTPISATQQNLFNCIVNSFRVAANRTGSKSSASNVTKNTIRASSSKKTKQTKDFSHAVTITNNNSVDRENSSEKENNREKFSKVELKDEKTGLSLIFPDNWINKGVEEHIFTFVKADELTFMRYVSEDVWSKLTNEEKNGHSRFEISGIKIQKEIEKAVFNENTVQYKTIAGKIYSVVDTVESTSINNKFQVFYNRNYLLLYNGVSYLFKFTTLNEDGKTKAEFEEIMKKIKFPEPTEADKKTHGFKGIFHDPKSRKAIPFIVQIFPMVFLRRFIFKDPVPQKLAIVISVGWSILSIPIYLLLIGSNFSNKLLFIFAALSFVVLIGNKEK